MNARKLTYDFLMLPPDRRKKIVLDLNLLSDFLLESWNNGEFEDQYYYRMAISNAKRKSFGLDMMRDAVEKHKAELIKRRSWS